MRWRRLPRARSVAGRAGQPRANRAFVTLNPAMMAIIVAITILNKSVLYYFKYLLGAPRPGNSRLPRWAVSAVAVPLWMLLARLVGCAPVRCGGGWASQVSTSFAWTDISPAARDAIIPGRHAVDDRWPEFRVLGDASEHYRIWRAETGAHLEGTVFGVAALLQRIAIGIATAILGWSFASAGYVANVQQSSRR